MTAQLRSDARRSRRCTGVRPAKAHPDAEVRVIDADHELPLEKPAEPTAALDRFVTGCS
ncbi:hypothetical protein [Streptomyces triticisoli]|uniref:hypothetical protein n=1 Tax=Streptomyces triticisoli TaxID=2182797 RepID=UPI003F6954CB